MPSQCHLHLLPGWVVTFKKTNWKWLSVCNDRMGNPGEPPESSVGARHLIVGHGRDNDRRPYHHRAVPAVVLYRTVPVSVRLVAPPLPLSRNSANPRLPDSFGDNYGTETTLTISMVGSCVKQIASLISTYNWYTTKDYRVRRRGTFAKTIKTRGPANIVAGSYAPTRARPGHNTKTLVLIFTLIINHESIFLPQSSF
jgi:hypothetical protein